MKKFRFLLMFLSVLAISACSSDDDNSSAAEIEGLWNADGWHMEGDMQGGTFAADGVDMGGITVIFKEDGTFVSDGDEFTVEYTINIQGMEVSDEFTNDNPFNTGTWEKNGDVLIIKNDGEAEVFDYHIDNLTSSRLDLSLDDYTIDEEGVEGTFEATMSFKR